VEISNRTSSPKRLELRIEGLRETVATLHPDKTIDLPERVKILRQVGQGFIESTGDSC
jgi:hypothetical protein